MPRLEPAPGWKNAARALTRRAPPLERRSRTDRASCCVASKRPLVFRVLLGCGGKVLSNLPRARRWAAGGRVSEGARLL